MAKHDTREVEAKFRVHPGFRLPDLSSVAAQVSGPTDQELRAVYWDSADLRLAREGITLRHRSGEGSADGWHLKLPVQGAGVPDAGVGSRDELHEQSPPDEVPNGLRDLVSVYLRSAVIGPVATLVTARSAYLLCDAEGQALAEVTDDNVSVLNQGHVVARFREIEVEDRGGGLATLGEVGQLLRSAGAVAGEFVPKVVRALGPQATAAPDPPAAATVSPKDPARALIQAVLRRYVRNFMRRDIEARRGQDDAIHQMRVAARRLRGALKTFRPLLDEAWADSLRAELAWVADGLGGARDAEVLLARLRADLDTLPDELILGPVWARIETAIGGDLERETAAAAALLRSERYMALVERLVAAAWDPMTTSGAEAKTREVVPPLLRAVWGRLDKRARRVGADSSDHEDWHQARIAAKQARYAFEAVTPVFGRNASRLAASAEQVQEVLGEHQDAVVSCEVIKRLATAPRSGTISFTLGLLYARQLDAIARTQVEFLTAWKPASSPKHRRWLTGR